MDVVWTALGIALIAVTLRDIFEVLFHPLGRGKQAFLNIRLLRAFIVFAPTSGKDVDLGA